MKKRIITLITVILLSLILSACGHEHIWEEANCGTPKTCSECGETEGESLGHNLIPASCEAAETCSRCGETFGSKLEHDWQEATCAAPKTCTNCGITSGKTLDHTWGNYNYETANCTQCGKSTPFLSVIQDFYPVGGTPNIDLESGELIFTAKDFGTRLMHSDYGEYTFLSADITEGSVYFLMERLDLSSNSIDSLFQDSLLHFFFLEAGSHKMLHHENTSSKINMISFGYPLTNKDNPVIKAFLYDIVYQINPSCSFYTFNQYFEKLDDDLDLMEALTGIRGCSKVDVDSNLAYQYSEHKEDNLIVLTISSLTAFENDF